MTFGDGLVGDDVEVVNDGDAPQVEEVLADPLLLAVQRVRSGQAAQVSFGKRTVLPGWNGMLTPVDVQLGQAPPGSVQVDGDVAGDAGLRHTAKPDPAT
jgi:hypothetical protein